MVSVIRGWWGKGTRCSVWASAKENGLGKTQPFSEEIQIERPYTEQTWGDWFSSWFSLALYQTHIFKIESSKFSFSSQFIPSENTIPILSPLPWYTLIFRYENHKVNWEPYDLVSSPRLEVLKRNWIKIFFSTS